MDVCAACVHTRIRGIFNVSNPTCRGAIRDCAGAQVTPRILLRRSGTPAME
jgi:hypothetical protein